MKRQIPACHDDMQDRKLDRFDITTGLPVASIVGVHRVSCQALHCHQSMIATGGSDGLVKVMLRSSLAKDSHAVMPGVL